MMYGKKVKSQLPGFYYWILWKSYLEEKYIWKLFATVIYLWKLINTSQKEHLKKPIVISLYLDPDLLIAEPTILKLAQELK